MKSGNKKYVIGVDPYHLKKGVGVLPYQQKLVVGVDGGGTKTIAALASLEGKILKLAKAGPSSFMKVGVEKTAFNIAKAIEKLFKNKKNIKILSTFIGLAAIEENKEMKRVIMKQLLRKKEISKIFKGKVKIGSDQIIGFKSGTDENRGVVLISGTGAVAHGWCDKKEAHASGWGWLADEGSAFWVGQKAYQAVFKDLDGRSSKTLMTSLFFKKFDIKKPGSFKKKILYGGNVIKKVSSLSVLVNEAAKKKDKIAISILKKAAKELALTAITVIKKLNFQNQKFPLVLVGSMFKSKTVLNTTKKEIKKTAPKVKFILPKSEPVIGAVKLAIENLK